MGIDFGKFAAAKFFGNDISDNGHGLEWFKAQLSLSGFLSESGFENHGYFKHFGGCIRGFFRLVYLEGKELGPQRFRLFCPNQGSELNFPSFLGKHGPNSEERVIHMNPS